MSFYLQEGVGESFQFANRSSIFKTSKNDAHGRGEMTEALCVRAHTNHANRELAIPVNLVNRA